MIASILMLLSSILLKSPISNFDIETVNLYGQAMYETGRLNEMLIRSPVIQQIK